MKQNRLSRFSLVALLSVLGGSALTTACDGSLPSDTTTTGTAATAGSAGNAGQGGSVAGNAGQGGSVAGNAGQGGSVAGNAGQGGSGGAGGGPDCVMNPMTHVEIINACTDAEKVDKVPVLPLLNPDGSLPPLP